MQAQQRARERQKEQLTKVRQILDQIPDEYKDEAQAVGTVSESAVALADRKNTTKSVEEARAAASDIQAQLDLSLNVDGNTVDRYNRLKEEVSPAEAPSQSC